MPRGTATISSGLGPAAHVRPLVDQYWQIWETHRQRPDRLNGHVAAPKVGILRRVVRGGHRRGGAGGDARGPWAWYRSIIKLWHAHDDHTYDAFFAWEPSLQSETILFGAPAQVREQLARLLEVSGCNYVIGAFAWGSLSHAQTLRSLRLFAEEVMPAFA